MFAKSLQEEGAEGQLQWLTRAEDEFKLALASEPGDWDTKYNYELSARLVAALRRPPKPGNKPSADQAAAAGGRLAATRAAEKGRMTLRFLHPDMAIWLLAVPAAAACWLIHVLYKHACRRRAAVQERFAPLSRRSTTLRDVAILALATISISLLVAALTQPQLLRERIEPEYERQSLIIILDRSVSMRARDILPSRAERALIEIKNFLRRKPDAIERVGLVGFAGSPVILAYLTKDLDNVMFYLDWISDDPTLLYGTDMGGALTSALEVTHRDPIRRRIRCS